MPDAAPRILIVTADIGAGHDLPAELLADGIRARRPDAAVEIVDGLAEMGPFILAATRNGAETILQRLPRLFDLQYRLATAFPPTRWLTAVIGMVAGGRGLLGAVRRFRPDAIVSTYPGTTEVMARFKRIGRLRPPLASAVTDLAALRWWAHPDVDLHLITHAESRAEVAAVAGPRADIRHVRGFSRPEFEDPPAPGAARAALGLPASAPVVAVSGGGWGIGDVQGAARAVLGIPGATAVCLCGTNAVLRERLEAAFRDEPRMRVEGFTDRMCEWLAAADVLVHSTAGLTVLEAQMCGTHVISYGWGVAHLRANNAAYRRFRLADVATTPAELRAALERALAAPRPVDRSFARLEHAADAVLSLAAAGRGARA